MGLHPFYSYAVLGVNEINKREFAQNTSIKATGDKAVLVFILSLAPAPYCFR
jgi:hypothetical protein